MKLKKISLPIYFAYFDTDNRGFGIVEVMIAGAIMSVLALALVSMLSSMSKAQKDIEDKSQYNQLFMELSSLLASNLTCGGLLNTTNAGVTSPTIAVPTNTGTAAAPLYSATDSFFTTGRTFITPDKSILLTGENAPVKDSKRKIMINRFGFIPGSLVKLTPDAPPATTGLPSPPAPQVYSVRLQLTASKILAPNQSAYGGTIFREQQFNLRLTTNANGTQFDSCVGGLAGAILACLPGQMVAGTDQLTGSSICSPDPPCEKGQSIIFNGTDWDCSAVNSNGGAGGSMEGTTVIMCSGPCG